MTEYTLLSKMAYQHYEECSDFYMPNNPKRDWDFAVKALCHFKDPKQEWDYRWRQNEEYFKPRVGDIYAEYELERLTAGSSRIDPLPPRSGDVVGEGEQDSRQDGDR